MSASNSAQTITWTEISESHIARVVYCEQTERMGVEFGSGALYAYEGVSVDVFEGLVGASSAGQYLDRVIKKSGLYNYERFTSIGELESSLLHH